MHTHAYTTHTHTHTHTHTVPRAPEGFGVTNTTASYSEVLFTWNATDGPVVLACGDNGTALPTIIRQLCGSCSQAYVDGFESSSRYTCTLSKKSGVTVGYSSVVNFITDVLSETFSLGSMKYGYHVLLYFAGLPPPNFTVTSVTSTTIRVNLGSSTINVLYRICPRLSNGQNIGLCTIHHFGGSRLINQLHPFTTYEVQVEVQEIGTNHWSYPSTQTLITLEEGK